MIAATNGGLGSSSNGALSLWNPILYDEHTEYTGKLPYIYCLPTISSQFILPITNIFRQVALSPRIGVNALESQFLTPNRARQR